MPPSRESWCVHPSAYLFVTHDASCQVCRLLGVSESKANLHRHRGNHMQTLTILGSTVKSPVDICPASSPTPAKPEVVFFLLWGHRCKIFFPPQRTHKRSYLTQTIIDKSADSSACRNQKPTYKDIEVNTVESPLDACLAVQPHRNQG